MLSTLHLGGRNSTCTEIKLSKILILFAPYPPQSIRLWFQGNGSHPEAVVSLSSPHCANFSASHPQMASLTISGFSICGKWPVSLMTTNRAGRFQWDRLIGIATDNQRRHPHLG